MPPDKTTEESKGSDPADDDETPPAGGNSFVDPIQRVQSGNACCFLIAPGLVHRYVLQKMGAPKGVMLDYSLYMRDCVSNEMLMNYLLHGQGSSLAVLKDLANRSFRDPKFITIPEEIIRRNPAHVSRALQCYGAGLVSEFRVERNFLDGAAMDEKSFDGAIDAAAGEVVGTHAMVLIGIRRDRRSTTGGGKWYLLLQNTWKSMPIVEMTVDYFLRAGPKLTFLEAKGVKASDGLPTNKGVIAEIDIEGNDVPFA